MEALYLKKYYDKWLKTGQCVALFFSFCLGYGQIASQKDCPTAMRICDVTQSYYFEVTNNIGALDDAYGLDQIYCQWGGAYPTWEWNPAWFVFTPQYSGEFGFLICPEVTTMNWDWALFKNPVCTDLNNIAYHLRCNTQPPSVVAEGCTGIGFKNGFGGGVLMV